MAHVQFTDIQDRPTEFLDVTSLTLEEFQQLGGCPRINTHPSVGLGCQPRCLHWRCFVGLDIISTRPGETFPMPYPPPKGSLGATSVALRGLHRPQGTSIAPQLEQIVT